MRLFLRPAAEAIYLGGTEPPFYRSERTPAAAVRHCRGGVLLCRCRLSALGCRQRVGANAAARLVCARLRSADGTKRSAASAGPRILEIDRARTQWMGIGRKFSGTGPAACPTAASAEDPEHRP